MDDYLYSIGSDETRKLFSKIMKDYYMDGSEVCVTPSANFINSKTFVSADGNLQLVYREDITNKKKHINLVPTDYVLYFDVKKKRDSEFEEDNLTYVKDNIVVLRRPGNTKGKLRRVEAVIDCILAPGERLYIADSKEKRTRRRNAQSYSVMGLKFPHEETLQFEEDLKVQKRYLQFEEEESNKRSKTADL
jgi:hypothetical protein